jgi:hypothetical protein
LVHHAPPRQREKLNYKPSKTAANYENSPSLFFYAFYDLAFCTALRQPVKATTASGETVDKTVNQCQHHSIEGTHPQSGN